MDKQIFICNNYGANTILNVGQKVECIYYHEYPRTKMKHSYKRKWWQFLDKPFKPVKLGVIVGDAGIHPYWLSLNEKKEQYLFVKFKEYFFAKPIPISCIQDAKKSAEIMERFLKANKHRIGENGYSQATFERLTEQMNKARLF